MSKERCAIWADWHSTSRDYWYGVKKPEKPVLVVCVADTECAERLRFMLEPKWGKRATLRVVAGPQYDDDFVRGLELERDSAGHPHKELVTDARREAAKMGITLVEHGQPLSNPNDSQIVGCVRRCLSAVADAISALSKEIGPYTQRSSIDATCLAKIDACLETLKRIGAAADTVARVEGLRAAYAEYGMAKTQAGKQAAWQRLERARYQIQELVVTATSQHDTPTREQRIPNADGQRPNPTAGPVPMFSPSDPETAPFEWVLILARAVRRWVRDPAIRRRFLEEYDESLRADGPADWLSGEMTLPGSFALLMAVHDKYANAERLVPDSGGAEFGTVKRNIAHVACMSQLTPLLQTQPNAACDMLRDAFRQVVDALKLPAADYYGAAEALGIPVNAGTPTRPAPAEAPAEASTPGSVRRAGEQSPAAADAKLDTLPALDTDSPNWVKNTRAAKLEGVVARTLAQYRHDGTTAKDGMLGIDPYGRMWRRVGTAMSHPWYFKPSLVSQQGTPLGTHHKP